MNVYIIILHRNIVEIIIRLFQAFSSDQDSPLHLRRRVLLARLNTLFILAKKAKEKVYGKNDTP
jgi:hypothetical protein